MVKAWRGRRVCACARHDGGRREGPEGNERRLYGPGMRRGSGAAPRRHVSVSNPAPLSQRSDMVVFLNGEFIPADQARVGIMSHAFSYGTGCFEGIRGYWNAQAGEKDRKS